MKYWISIGVVFLAALGAALSGVNEYFFYAGYIVLTFVVLSTAWNILGGYAGYVNFGTGAFFGLGSYSAVVLFKALQAPLAVQIAGGYNAPSDYDADARSDDLDNCPFIANNDQQDRGGLATLVPNGRGDRCECGEATDDGAIFAADSNVIRQLLAGLPVPQPIVALDRCSVAATPGCDVADLAVLRRALAGLGPFPVAACTTAVR